MGQPLKVVYPYIEERSSNDFGYQVLKLALSKSGVDYQLSINSRKSNQLRAQKLLEDGEVSLIDVGTSADFEKRFDAIHFPIDRGLSGYRLFIIHNSQAEQFSKVRSIEDLKKKVAGQGPGWADVKILSAAGIDVQTSQFESLFAMVDKGRFDFLPLGVEEVHGFLKRYQTLAPNSIVEQRIALHYPFARFFFVQRGNKVLHDAILSGLESAFADGSFQQLLEGNPLYSEGLNRANLKQRLLIEIDNPLMTAEFKNIPKKYFVSP